MNAFGEAERAWYMTDGQASGRRGGPFGFLWRTLRAPRTYTSLFYLLLSFPLGIAYFVALVTLIATGGGLAITLVGIPLLIFTMFGWCAIAAIDVRITNALVGPWIAPIPFNPEPGATWQARLIARTKSWLTWRCLVFLLYRSVEGVATFTAAVSVVATAGALLITPVLVLVDSDGSQPDIGGWRVDTVAEALPFFIAGLILLPTSLALGRATAVGSARIGAWILGAERPMVARPALRDRSGDSVFALEAVAAPETLGTFAEATVRIGQLALNPLTHIVTLADVPVPVTPKEFDLLQLFMTHPGRAFHRDDLIERIWAGDEVMTDRTIDTHIQRLRRKLGDEAQRIQTVRGVGYKLDNAATVAEAGAPPAGW